MEGGREGEREEGSKGEEQGGGEERKDGREGDRVVRVGNNGV